MKTISARDRSPASPSRCEAALRLGERRPALDRDFVLLVRAAEPETPRSVVERAPEGTVAAKIVFPPLEATGAAPGEVLNRPGFSGGSNA